MKIEKNWKSNQKIVYNTEQEGAVSTEHPTNPRVQKERERDRGLRQARDIIIETHTNQRWTQDLASGEEEKETHKMNWAAALQQHTNSPTAGSSRETTPRSSDESQAPGPPASNFPQEIGYFSGNPIVEVTKGIIHLYKKKWVQRRHTEACRAPMRFLCLQRTQGHQGGALESAVSAGRAHDPQLPRLAKLHRALPCRDQACAHRARRQSQPVYGPSGVSEIEAGRISYS